MNKKAKHAAAAQKFAEFASSLEGAKAIAGIGVVPAYQSDEIRAQYFTLPGMPTDDLAKKAFAPDKVNPEMPTSDKTAKVDTILAEEHQLILTKENRSTTGSRRWSPASRTRSTDRHAGSRDGRGRPRAPGKTEMSRPPPRRRYRASAAPSPPRPRNARRARRNTLIGWSFILPNFLGFVALTLSRWSRLSTCPSWTGTRSAPPSGPA